MQQEKMGCLLRELRKEKGMTQEHVAEVFGVTSRTVSRWENGINMPDISMLIDISNYFEIGILELIEGERKQETMTMKNNEELKKIADYADEQKCIVLKNVHRTDVAGFIGCILSAVSQEAYAKYGNNIWLLLQIMFLGLAGSMLFSNILYESGIDYIMKQKSKKHRFLKYLELLLLIILLISLCRDSYLILIGAF